MSIDDFDNNAPDNRSTEKWTRLADAARHDERRKIWRACGLEGSPPADDAEFVTKILDAGARCVGLELPVVELAEHMRRRPDLLPAVAAEVRLIEVKTGPEVFGVDLPARAHEIAEYERGRREELAEVWRAAGIVTAIEDRSPAQVAAALLGRGRQHALRAALHAACLPVPDSPSDFDTAPVVAAIERKARNDGQSAALDEVWRTVATYPLPHGCVTPESLAWAVSWRAIANVLVRLGGDAGQMPEDITRESVELLERRVFRHVCEELEQRAASEALLAAVHETPIEGSVKDAAQSHGATSARVAGTVRSRIEGLVKDGRRRLADVYSCFRGEIAPLEWTADDLVARCVLEIEALVRHEPEQHEEVEVATTAGLVLRSADLARGIAALEAAGSVDLTRYLRLPGEPAAYFVQVDPPAFSLPEEREHQLAADAAAALDARDGAGYLEVLREASGSAQRPVPTSDAPPGEVVRDGRIEAIYKLREPLSALRAALGLRSLDVMPVYVYELRRALHDVAVHVARAREAVCWLAARDALSICDVRERLLVRQAEHGRRGLDLETLTSCWYTYWRERVSDELNEEIATVALRLQG